MILTVIYAIRMIAAGEVFSWMKENEVSFFGWVGGVLGKF